MECISNIIQTHNISTLPKGHTVTYHHRFEQESCSMVQSRPAHEAHLQQGSTNPEYKSTQQDLTKIRLIRLRNAGSGIQGIALAINKVLLRKSFLTRFYISTNKTSSRSYIKLTWSIMRSWNSISTSFSNLTQVPFIYYDDEQWVESP